jgi:hypothetical protein
MPLRQTISHTQRHALVKHHKTVWEFMIGMYAPQPMTATSIATGCTEIKSIMGLYPAIVGEKLSVGVMFRRR